jgi:hypothetical protein
MQIVDSEALRKNQKHENRLTDSEHILKEKKVLHEQTSLNVSTLSQTKKQANTYTHTCVYIYIYHNNNNNRL